MSKKVHLGKKVNARGQCSALCFDPPRAINMKRESWTLDESAVTCSDCRSVIELSALRASLAQVTAERDAMRRELRMEWWANHGCSQAAMYGDDGERSCGECCFDFKRADFDQLRAHVQQRRNLRLIAALDGGK